MLQDRQLINDLKCGSNDAFNLLYEKYIDDLYSLAVNLLADQNLAQDVVQDVLIALVQSADKIRIRTNLKGYLLTCIANRSRDYMRKNNRRPTVSVSQAIYLKAESPDPAESAIRSEQLRLAANALGQLVYDQREVVVLYLQGKLKFRQIAKLQNVSIKTVQSRYRYGIDKLRSILNGEVKK